MKQNCKGPACASFFRKAIAPILALLITATAFSQTTCSGPIEKRAIYVSDLFNEVEVRGEIVVVLTTQPAGELMVEANVVDLYAVKTTVKKGRLIIEADNRKCTSRMTVSVSLTNVNTLIINRESEIFSFGKVKVATFK